MNIEQKIEIFLGTGILAILGYLAVNQFNMNGTLSIVTTKIDSTDQRLSRIADTLPELKARVAWEEINYPLAGFVTASNPIEVTQDKWETNVGVYDGKSGKLKSWVIKLGKNHKNFAAYVVAGKVRSDNPYNTSFAELSYYSGKEKEPVSVPATINAHTSFVIRTGDVEEYSTYLKEITKAEPEVKDIGQLTNWKEVAKKLEEIK